MKGQCHRELYQVRKEQLAIYEQLSQTNQIDLYYADETHISETGYVPYGWQHKEENVFIPIQKGKRLNCFGLLTRDMSFHYALTNENINATFVLNYLDSLSHNLAKLTVIVMDNASVHHAKMIQDRLPIWQERGLFICYLPPYSPHLNIIERLWKEVKQAWLRPRDYISFDSLSYAVNRVFANIGTSLSLNFSSFKV
nr:IS630 family transposase [Moraxella osloensis]